jgi:hypothetical protein
MPEAILRKAGMAFMGATGGAIGVILGKALSSGGLALRGTAQIGRQVRGHAQSMDSAVAAREGEGGDKTILDAIHAAAGVARWRRWRKPCGRHTWRRKRVPRKPPPGNVRWAAQAAWGTAPLATPTRERFPSASS